MLYFRRQIIDLRGLVCCSHITDDIVILVSELFLIIVGKGSFKVRHIQAMSEFV